MTKNKGLHYKKNKLEKRKGSGFIHHFTSNFSDDFFGFVVKESKDFYYYVDPITITWMNKIKIENWQDVIEMKKIHKNLIKIKEIDINYSFEEWIFEYPISEEELIRFNDVSLFFGTFYRFKNHNLTRRLELTIGYISPYMPHTRLEEFVSFVFEKNKTNKERLRLLMSEEITKFLKYKGSN